MRGRGRERGWGGGDMNVCTVVLANKDIPNKDHQDIKQGPPSMHMVHLVNFLYTCTSFFSLSCLLFSIYTGHINSMIHDRLSMCYINHVNKIMDTAFCKKCPCNVEQIKMINWILKQAIFYYYVSLHVLGIVFMNVLYI